MNGYGLIYSALAVLLACGFLVAFGFAVGYDRGTATVNEPAQTVGSKCGALLPGQVCDKDSVLNVNGTPQVMLVSTPSPNYTITRSGAFVHAAAYGEDATGEERALRVDAQGRVECAK